MKYIVFYLVKGLKDGIIIAFVGSNSFFVFNSQIIS